MIDGVLVVSTFILMQFLLLETIRRGVLTLVLGHVVCEEVRMKALGEGTRYALERSYQFLNEALNSQQAQVINQKAAPHFYSLFETKTLKRLKLSSPGGGVSERHLRYPQLLSFKMKNNRTKHHQEILARCLFPFSL